MTPAEKAKDALIYHLKYFPFSYYADEPPPPGMWISVSIEGEDIRYYVSKIEEETSLCQGVNGTAETIKAYKVTAMPWLEDIRGT